MKPYLLLLLAAMCLYAGSEARSPQVCGYTTLDGKMVFLHYFPGIKEGEDYIDNGSGTDGVCSQRAVCQEDYSTKVESCNDYKVDCNNRGNVETVFPACCMKC
ncbi:PREDICTED: uncharacterized protein LOC108978430 [Bactrocera latifrons]|uniref:Single domain-containing protein n=1 Tax=Bactrocera latifrons TaxID=174628 RepID=A0A0K8VNW0_BACLA|nr:PREDICTED: uncharacterized protein LOC108978430 [Bactrocera latifrons]